MAETIFQILQWAIPSGGIGAAIAWIANRRLRTVEEKKKMEELRGENDKTRRALNRLSRAIEAIQLCPHRAACPVSGELSLSEDSDKGKPHRTRQRSEGSRTADEHPQAVAAAGDGARVTGDAKRS